MTFPLRVVTYVCGECPHQTGGPLGYGKMCRHPDVLQARGGAVRPKDGDEAPHWCPLLQNRKEPDAG